MGCSVKRGSPAGAKEQRGATGGTPVNTTVRFTRFSKHEKPAVSEVLAPPRRPHWACYGGAPRCLFPAAGLPLFTLHPIRAKAPTKLHSPKGSFRHLAFARERKEPERESDGEHADSQSYTCILGKESLMHVPLPTSERVGASVYSVWVHSMSMQFSLNAILIQFQFIYKSLSMSMSVLFHVNSTSIQG